MGTFQPTETHRYNRSDSDGTPLTFYGTGGVTPLGLIAVVSDRGEKMPLLLDMPMCPACHSDNITNSYDEEKDDLTIYCRSCGRHWSLE